MDVMKAVERHHQLVRDKGYDTVMTVLVGSQNYHLDVPESDVDTFTFVMPSFDDLAAAKEPVSEEFQVEDGKCMYKDMRLALNLLKKTSPNSVECFVGQYRVFDYWYEQVLKKYLNDWDKMNYMVHCNYHHMLYAMAGMAHQLTKRNMLAGKRYSHALRLLSMADTYVDSLDSRNLLELLPRDYDEAFSAKRDSRELDYYNEGCTFVAQKLEKLRDEFQLTDFKAEVETRGMQLVTEFQQELLQYHLTKLQYYHGRH